MPHLSVGPPEGLCLDAVDFTDATRLVEVAAGILARLNGWATLDDAGYRPVKLRNRFHRSREATDTHIVLADEVRGRDEVCRCRYRGGTAWRSCRDCHCHHIERRRFRKSAPARGTTSARPCRHAPRRRRSPCTDRHGWRSWLGSTLEGARDHQGGSGRQGCAARHRVDHCRRSRCVRVLGQPSRRQRDGRTARPTPADDTSGPGHVDRGWAAVHPRPRPAVARFAVLIGLRVPRGPLQCERGRDGMSRIRPRQTMPPELLLHVTPDCRVTAGTAAFAPGLLRPLTRLSLCHPVDLA